MSIYNSINYSKPLPETFDTGFTIECPPNTDVWEKPPSVHSFNAPILYRISSVSSFKSARVAVSADWKHKYDQGGLCFVINPNSDHKQWVKTGIEYLNGQPRLSTVATDRWSDWSLQSIPENTESSEGAKTSPGATIEMVIEDGSLWVYLIEGVKRSPMREVTWMADVDKESECWVGVYAAKPAKENENLEVNFTSLKIELT